MTETENGSKELISADTVIIAIGSRPVDNLLRQVKGKGTEVFSIGDAKEPRKIIDAVREGFDAALKV